MVRRLNRSAVAPGVVGTSQLHDHTCGSAPSSSQDARLPTRKPSHHNGQAVTPGRAKRELKHALLAAARVRCCCLEAQICPGKVACSLLPVVICCRAERLAQCLGCMEGMPEGGWGWRSPVCTLPQAAFNQQQQQLWEGKRQQSSRICASQEQVPLQGGDGMHVAYT